MNHNGIQPVRMYGITQDPETSNYMVILEEMKVGNLIQSDDEKIQSK